MEDNPILYKQALEILRMRIKESTSSMTSVPKPLKFLRDHFENIKTIYQKIKDKETKVRENILLDIIYLSLIINFYV